MLDLLQWPAMVVTIVGAWLVASRSERRRSIGFWVYLVSNAAWLAWAWHARAYALMALQVILAVMSIRGVRRNDAT